MNKTKILHDIRFYASEIDNIEGNSLPGLMKDFIKFPKSLHSWSDRIARKLSEYKFSLGNYDHLYINYTTVLNEGKIIFSDRIVEKWFRYVDYGVDKKSLMKMNEEELSSFLKETTFHILRHLSQENVDALKIISIVETELKKFGTELEIERKRKETKSYTVVISYQINPFNQKSKSFIYYKNHKTRKEFKRLLVELYHYEDIFPLVGTISVKSKNIVIQPRKSFKADIYTKQYKPPLIIICD